MPLPIPGDATAHDARCGRCGSLLYSVVRGRAFVHVACARLLDKPSLAPTVHIVVESKALWHRISGKLPRPGAFAELGAGRPSGPAIVGAVRCRPIENNIEGVEHGF